MGKVAEPAVETVMETCWMVEEVMGSCYRGLGPLHQAFPMFYDHVHELSIPNFFQ